MIVGGRFGAEMMNENAAYLSASAPSFAKPNLHIMKAGLGNWVNDAIRTTVFTAST